MLQMGSSKPWPDAMEVLTGQRDMDATGLLDYFSPLADWLERDNRESGEHIGWEPTEKRKYPCRKFTLFSGHQPEGSRFGHLQPALLTSAVDPVVAGCVQTQEELGFEEGDDERRIEKQTDAPRSDEI
jgi:hypothetical protein